MKEGMLLIGIVLLAVALSVGISAGVGYGVAWVLGKFGVHVAWYVCSVATFLLGFIVRGWQPSKS